MPTGDAETTRLAQREIGRRSIDTSGLDVHATHGVVYLRGYIKCLRGHPTDLRHELEVINRVLRTKPGIREVIIEVDIRE
ncbi:MAG: hypothetical protein KBC96_07815 [Armatimonadetes bacterium]|nr:hypothetical protein [Armatimonadota bacterium]